MGLVIDTDVWVLAERSGSSLNLVRWAHYGGAYMSAITASELLEGVERANTIERRALRSAFVENLLASIPVLEFSTPVTRTHARMVAALPKNVTAGAHHALIAATAVHHGYALLTIASPPALEVSSWRSRGILAKNVMFIKMAKI